MTFLQDLPLPCPAQGFESLQYDTAVRALIDGMKWEMKDEFESTGGGLCGYRTISLSERDDTKRVRESSNYVKLSYGIESYTIST
eukprot:scaffold9751_cov153-Skeletonema_menzelii.AAC.1